MKNKIFLAVCSVLAYGTLGFGAPIILNEYNAVSGSNYLNGGTAESDIDGGYAQDSYFGRVLGNGGDWFELVVTQDNLNMQGWKLGISYFDGTTRLTEVLNLTNHGIWSNLRSGTIITISEDVPDDVSYDPLHGDWWINVRANATSGSGTYIERQNFPVSNDDWQLTIMNAGSISQFGPAGEGISPVSGIGNTEIFRLEADPSASIGPASSYYGAGKNLSTFGSPNRWGGGNEQDFNQLRSWVPEPATLFILGLGTLSLRKRRQSQK